MPTTARRRIIRPVPLTQQPNSQRLRQLQKLRSRLEHERAALGRWQTRLKRAFNATERHQKRIVRLERQLAQLEES